MNQGIKFLDIQNPDLSQKLSKIPEIIKPVLDLADVLLDEKLVKDYINFIEGFLEKCIEEKKKPFDFNDPFTIETLLNQELRDLVVGLTNNINKLASERTEENNIDTETLDTIATKIDQGVGNIRDYPRPQPGDTPVDFWKALKDALANAEFQKQLKHVLTTTQSKGKWYQDPVTMGCCGVLLSALLVWLFLKRKRQSKYENTKK